MLSRDQFFAGSTLPQETVTVPQLGGELIVRGLTGFARDRFEASMVMQPRGGTRQVKTENIRAKLVALTVVGDDGTLLFTDDDVSAIGAVRADVIELLFDVAMRLSGMTPADVDELSKN